MFVIFSCLAANISCLHTNISKLYPNIHVHQSCIFPAQWGSDMRFDINYGYLLLITVKLIYGNFSFRWKSTLAWVNNHGLCMIYHWEFKLSEYRKCKNNLYFSTPEELPAIPVKTPTRKSAPGRVHGQKNPQKCAHEPVFCTSELTRAGSVPNNSPMGQLLEETMVFITCVINTLSGTWRSNEGATYYFTKYCCVKWKCRIYDDIVSIICLNDVLYIHAKGGRQTTRPVIFDTETHHFHMLLQHKQEYQMLSVSSAVIFISSASRMAAELF